MVYRITRTTMAVIPQKRALSKKKMSWGNRIRMPTTSETKKRVVKARMGG